MMLNAPAMSPNGFFSRPSLPGGIRPVTAIIKAVARAFTFASIFSSVWFVFLFLFLTDPGPARAGAVC